MSVCLSLFYYLFNKEIENRRNNYYCTLITTINTLRMLLILSIKSTLSNGVYGSQCRLMKDIVQAVHFGLQLPPASVSAMVKSKQRSIDTLDDANLPIYNAGNRRGPPSRRYLEVTSTQIMEDAWKKNLLWLLALFHSSENQTIPSWTGFNILVRNKHVVAKDSVVTSPLSTLRRLICLPCIKS